MQYVEINFVVVLAKMVIDMPYKSEKIKIEGTSYDRRRKLSEDTKEYIRWLREEEQISYQKLANMFNVSKKLIIFVCNPDKESKAKEQFKIRRKDGRYSVSKDERAEIMREHRRYKHDLYLMNKINCN